MNKAEDTINAGDTEWMGLYAVLEVTVPLQQDGSDLTFTATHMSVGSGARHLRGHDQHRPGHLKL